MSNNKANSTNTETAELENALAKVSRAYKLSTLFSGTILVAIGFAIGAGILLWDYFPFSGANLQFIKWPPFQLFFLATIAQTVFWAVALGSMWPSLSSLIALAKEQKTEIITWALLFMTLIYASTYFAVSCEYNLRHHTLKMNLLTYIGGLVALMAGIGSILVNIGLRNLLTSDIPSEEPERERAEAGRIKRYLQLRGFLLQFLSLLGVMLGLVTLSQSAKRNLIMSFGDSTCETSFTIVRVLVFGLYYTLILVLTFLPTFSTLIATGRKLRDDIFPIPSPQSETWASMCVKRAKLEKLLGLTTAESLRALIAVFAPIIGSLISLLQLISRFSR